MYIEDLMLIRFSVSNFLSFKEAIDLRMVASAERIHPQHVVRTKSRNQPNLLRVATVYGPNAAGKSNLVKAFKFVQNLVVTGVSTEARIPVQRFRLDPACLKQPAKFEIEFRMSEVNYAYSFAVEPEKVCYEELSTTTNTAETLLFSRKTSIEGDVQVTFGSFYSQLHEKDKQFLEFIARGTRSNQLFLRETIERNEKRFRPIYNWFRRVLTIIEPTTEYRQLELRLDTDQDFREFLGRVLKAAGTGISAIKTQETSLDSIEDLPREILEDAQEQLSEDQFIYIRGNNGARFAITKRDDQIRVLRLTTVHGGGNSTEATFEVHEESDGTQRLFDLTPMLYGLTVGASKRVYVIDEIGRSLHPHLTNLIVGMHLDSVNTDKSSQLIVTTHETNLLDLDILRRDEIWFVEKREDGSTDLYSLSDFQPRYDKDIRRDYLVGRYGAIPFIGNVQHLRLPGVNMEADSTREGINAL